jgi:hypothetical protein
MMHIFRIMHHTMTAGVTQFQDAAHLTSTVANEHIALAGTGRHHFDVLRTTNTGARKEHDTEQQHKRRREPHETKES